MKRISNKLTERSRNYFYWIKLFGVPKPKVHFTVVHDQDGKLRDCWDVGITEAKQGEPTATSSTTKQKLLGKPVTIELKREHHFSLSKKEAIAAMKKGFKVAHTFFTDEEFIYMKDGEIYDENDYQMNAFFWEFRKGAAWETNWKILTSTIKL